MKRVWRGVLVVACVLPFARIATAETLNLTDEERAWIRANPVVRIAVDPYWKPVEYIEDGHYLGLSSEYVRALERKTGLRFEIVPDTGWGRVNEKLAAQGVDLLPAALKAFTTPVVRQYIDFSSTYYVGTTVIVTKNESESIFDLDRLNGKVVALKGGGAYQSTIEQRYPKIRVMPTKTSEEALLAVIRGDADAALDASQVMHPFLSRKYRNVLHVAGAVSSLPMELAMGVNKDLPILRSIIDKSLASLTPKETGEMIQRWYEGTDFGAPSLSVLVHYYGTEVALILVILVLISGFALHARRERLRAARSEKEKTMFLAVMSHEIRSPMNAILASIELLYKYDLPAEPRRLIGIASGSAESLLQLLNDILDISKIEAGALELDLVPVDVAELVTTCTDPLSLQAQEKGVKLSLELDQVGEQRIILDRVRIGQILHNLISNAVKFTFVGEIVVSARFEAQASSKKGALHLSVADTGIGMDDATKHKIFRPYTQADASTARKFGGTGLGLPICRQLVDLMRGTLDMQSELGVGTTITISLPCKRHAGDGRSRLKTALTSEKAMSPVRLKSNIGVLLVEDMPGNQAVMLAQLEALGCKAELASDGENALSLLKKEHFDVVLMDCDLPDISGYDVVRQWRRIEVERGMPPTPIIAISASTGAGHASACFDAGMDGVLNKPIKLGKLRDALQLWVDAALEDVELVTLPADDRRAIIMALEADLQEMRRAWACEDFERAAHFAHRLTGAFDISNVMELGAVTRELEHRFRRGGDDPFPFDTRTVDVLEFRFHAWCVANEPEAIVNAKS